MYFLTHASLFNAWTQKRGVYDGYSNEENVREFIKEVGTAWIAMTLPANVSECSQYHSYVKVPQNSCIHYCPDKPISYFWERVEAI